MLEMPLVFERLSACIVCLPLLVPGHAVLRRTLRTLKNLRSSGAAGDKRADPSLFSGRPCPRPSEARRIIVANRAAPSSAPRLSIADNATYLAGRERMYDSMRRAGVPEE
jgi:hypothetical protein